MILVELTRALRPACSGQSLLLPAEVARQLIAEGGAKNPRDRFGNPLPVAAELPAFVSRPTYPTKTAAPERPRKKETA